VYSIWLQVEIIII